MRARFGPAQWRSGRVSYEQVWDQLNWLWTSFYAVTLAVPALSVLLDPTRDAGERLRLVGAAAVLFGLQRVAARALHGVTTVSRREVSIGVGWYVASLAVLLPAVAVAPTFSIAQYGLISQIFYFLPRMAALVGVVTVIPLLLLAQEGLDVFRGREAWSSSLASVVLAALVGVFIYEIAQQSERRRQAVAELTTARAEAEALLRASHAVGGAHTVAEVVEAVGVLFDAQPVVVALYGPGGAPMLAAAPAESGAPHRMPASAAAVPLEGRVETLAVLPVAGGMVDSGVWRSVSTIAAAVTLALENLELVEQARQAGAAAERSRLAREIHDTLAQGLVSVLTQIEAADHAGSGTGATARHLDLARQAARAALEDARRSVQALRPTSLHEAPSLPAAIDRGGAALACADRPPGRADRHRQPRSAHARGRGHAAARRPGRAGERGPARQRAASDRDLVLPR